MLEDLAPNYTKLPATGGRGMEEAARISRELDLPRRQPGSVNSYLNNLAAPMNYAENEELIQKSPARDLMLPITTRKKDRRNPFSIEQLGRISSPFFYRRARVLGSSNSMLGGGSTTPEDYPERSGFAAATRA